MSLAMRLYSAAPLWMQHLLASLKGLEFRYRRQSDRQLRRFYGFLMQSERWDEGQYLDYQVAQLRRILQIAFARVPYYRELAQHLGCEAGDFKDTRDLRRLPMLEKSTLRGHEHEFLNEDVPKWWLYRGFTSGTTGTPLRIYETRGSFSRRFAFVARLRTWAGVTDPFYPRRAQFTGRDIVPVNQPASTNVYWRWNWFGNALLFSTSHISERTAPFYADALRRLGPQLIDGYPSALCALARLCMSAGLDLPRPKAVIVTAETLMDDARRDIEAGFGAKVYNQYAASEPSCFWCECEYGTLHVNPEYGISEILKPDGTPAEPGEEGEVVVTSFLNPAMPLIRYRLGDVAIPGPPKPCECGRRMPRIERVVGRVDDVLFVPERGYVGRLDPVFKGLRGIVEAQIVQEELDRVRVLVVPDKGWDETVLRKLLDNLRAKLGIGVFFNVELVDRIPRGPNGKFRAVVSKVRSRSAANSQIYKGLCEWSSSE